MEDIENRWTMTAGSERLLLEAGESTKGWLGGSREEKIG
jgi:hypothetical protein